MQGPTAVKQQVSDVLLSRGERRLIWKTLHDLSSSVALATLDENQAALDGTAPSVNLQSARHVTPEGRSGWDNAGEGDDPVRCVKEVDPSRLATGFAHVLRGVTCNLGGSQGTTVGHVVCVSVGVAVAACASRSYSTVTSHSSQ